MRAQDVIHDVPKRFCDANSVADLLRDAAQSCCKRKQIFPTSDLGRTPPIRGFVCVGCKTAWNITESLWEKTVVHLPAEYRDYFDDHETVMALCAALNKGVPGVVRGQ